MRLKIRARFCQSLDFEEFEDGILFEMIFEEKEVENLKNEGQKLQSLDFEKREDGIVTTLFERMSFEKKGVENFKKRRSEL